MLEVVTHAETLAQVEPNPTLLRAILQTKHLMNQQVLALARELVNKVVAQLLQSLKTQVRRVFSGTQARRRSPHRLARNFDARGTLRKNLGTYDRQTRRLYIETPLFFSRTRKQCPQWQVIITVDQSHSMVGSVMHSAVTAACLWGIPALKAHLLVFDTQVVDLTPHVVDPVETLMKVQLGGGTDIDRAVRYAASLVENPQRAVLVLITDLYEGGNAERLVHSVKRLCAQGTQVLVLAALDGEADPTFDRALGQRLANAGAAVGAMTPGQLVHWLGEVLS